MSVRLLTTRLMKHGRYFLQTYWRRDIHNNILEQNNKARNRIAAPTASRARATASSLNTGKNILNASLNVQTASSSVPRTAGGIFRFGQHARKLFIDNILNRVTTTYSQELRTQATKKLFYGDSAPFFALIGVSLASGAGVLTKEDELEGVCWEIRDAAGRLQSTWYQDDISENLDSFFSIDKLNIGPAIAKGCAAVVYAASLKSSFQNSDIKLNPSADKQVDSQTLPNPVPLPAVQQSFRPEFMTPLQNMSRFVHNFGSSVDNLNIYSQSSAAAVFGEHFEQGQAKIAKNDLAAESLGISSGMNEMLVLSAPHASIDRYPLALKMMFNYDIQSNAMSILRAMYKETVPARQRNMTDASTEWERMITDQTLTLPTHPNIVCMYGFFCDEVGNFPDGSLLYPIAQPQRINPNGYGRNMSLYLLMKRYDYSLRNFLNTHELSTRSKLLLFTQLLEAVAHISRHGIAHRDIKSDNILIEMNDDDSPPTLVLSDFGCCLADKMHGLQVPYTSIDIDKGGNAALMAPEIINKQPGPFAILNYGKADLWACGAIAYEIFGLPNPFYSSDVRFGEQTVPLRNNNYKEEDLPLLGDECPHIIQQLIYNILNPNPAKRVSPDIAANIMELYLWAPSNWLKAGSLPNSPEILQWLLSLTTKIMCEGRATNKPRLHENINFHEVGRRTYVEYLLICSFLARARLRRIRGALNWIQNVN